METEFKFNKDYRDLDQVAPFMPAFLCRYNELIEEGEYPYNDSFKGHLGVTGDEDTLIYLCQEQRMHTELAANVADALASGYVQVDEVDEPIKCDKVVVYGFYTGGTGWKEYSDCRLIHGLTGFAVLPKRARTRGYNLMGGTVLVKLASVAN